MPSLAAELWLIEIFPRLALVALIRCRCVCQTWRQLVLHADVSPIRCSLYELYLDVIDSDGFLSSRQRILSLLQPFDREGYIASLRSQTHAFIPPEFELYILEWPEKAILCPIWPGLPLDQDATNWSAGICRGINHTATIPPLLYRLQVDFDCIDSHVAAADVLDKIGSYDLLSFPGLPLWQRRSGTIFWLCFAQTPFLRCCVLHSEESDIEIEIDEELNHYESWIDLLRRRWLIYLDVGEWRDDPKPTAWIEETKSWNESLRSKTAWELLRSKKLGDISVWPVWKEDEEGNYDVFVS